LDQEVLKAGKQMSERTVYLLISGRPQIGIVSYALLLHEQYQNVPGEVFHHDELDE